MKLQIDTKAKTVKIDETVKINELIKVLKKLLPKEWQDYSLETGCFIYWNDPIIIKQPYYPWNPVPWPNPIITCKSNIDTGYGIYNYEIATIN